MSIKTKLETQDEDTSKVNIRLFATADEAVKDVKINEETVIKIKVKEEHKK